LTNGFLGRYLDRPIAEPEHRDFVATIHRSGENLHKILSEILDLSKIEAGMLEIRNRPFSPGVVTREVVDRYEAMAKEKRLKLLVKIEESLPSNVEGDPDRIRRILSNLLSNGIKITDKDRAREVGMQDYLIKPVSKEQIREAVQTFQDQSA